MADIIRSWLCLNSRCSTQFEAWDANPACSKCGCVRVQWVPGGGHVAGSAKAADAELRGLADHYGLGDINSARRDERAKPKLPPQPVVDRNTPSINFGHGFTAPVHAGGAAMCIPSTSNVNFKARVATGRALPSSRSVPGVHAGTTLEASHRPLR